MKPTTKHTPTPWRYESHPKNGGNIMDSNGDSATTKDNAAFIVQACNAHEALVEALEMMVRVKPDDDPIVMFACVERARHALALAKGGE